MSQFSRLNEVDDDKWSATTRGRLASKSGLEEALFSVLQQDYFHRPSCGSQKAEHLAASPIPKTGLLVKAMWPNISGVRNFDWMLGDVCA